MNAAVKTLQQKNWVLAPSADLVLTKNNLWTLLLTALVLLSAFSVVYAKERHRQLFTEVQMLQQSRDTLQEQWSQLLLEQGAWSTQARIQGIASTRGQMVFPRADQTVRVYR